jgi:hypothetical protein
MSLSCRLLRGLVVSALVAGAAAAGGAVDSSPAEAAPLTTAQRTSGYNFEGTAFGTRVSADGLRSGRSAFSYVACTQQTGKRHDAELATLSVPSESPMVHVGTVSSTTRTYAASKRGIAAAVKSVNKIGDVQLGGGGTPLLSFSGLRTTSTAWATKDGQLRTSNDFSAGEIELELLEDTVPRGPLKDLVDSLTGGIDAVLAAIVANGGTITVPGLGDVSVGFDKQVRRASTAYASGFVLQVKLFATDATEEMKVELGRSYARITRGDVAGVMNGVGWGASGQVLDGTLSLGGLGDQVLPCAGTDGQVLSTPVAEVDLTADGLDLGVLQGRVSGTLRSNGRATAWTEGSVAGVAIGGLEISGIKGRVNVAQDRQGRIVRKDFTGSTIGSISFDGTEYGSFDLATAQSIPALDVPGVAKLEFFQRETRRRGGRISAVVITLLEGDVAGTEIRLGNARASIAR